jgi:hypothetical protein
VVKVSVEVRNGTARFDVVVQAQSIQRALSFVAERYPKGNVRVRFPISPEGFFVRDPTAQAAMVGIEKPDPIAA